MRVKVRSGHAQWATVATLATAMLVGAGHCASAATLEVKVDGLVPTTGSLYVSLCAGSLEPSACTRSQAVAVTAAAQVVTFGDVAPGTYAVAAFEDLNGNMTLDRSAHGLPLEPYGFSNNAGRTGQPRFAAAAFTLEGDRVLAVHLAKIAGSR